MPFVGWHTWPSVVTGCDGGLVMDLVTLGAMLAAIAGGAGGALGAQASAAVSALVRHPFRHHDACTSGAPVSGVAEMAALEDSPADQDRAMALAGALLARANADSGFRQGLEGWWAQASQVRVDIDIDVTVRAAAAVLVALAQLPPSVGLHRSRHRAGGAGGAAGPGGGGAAVVSAVAGLAGVGKTTLAVEAGHAARQRGWFGGGVLFIDLHGYDETPVEPSQALDALLRALGVPGEHIPPDRRGAGRRYTGRCSRRSATRCW